MTGIFDRLNLKYKFIIITTIAIVFFMGIIGYLAVEREKDILYNEAVREGRLLGETLAIPIINDLIYERLGLVEEGGLLDNYILEIFNRKDLDLIHIAILDEEGRVLSHNNIAEYGKVYSDPMTLKALAAGTTLIQNFSDGGHRSLDFGVPLTIGKKRWGTLKFGLSLKNMELEIAYTVRKIIFLTIFLLFAGFAVILLLSKRFISPITELAATMERTDAEYLSAKVEIKGHDELAVLGERFNRMIERIRQANEELKKTHEKLIQSEKLASIGILAAGVAHEINNPLGGLFNCLQMLRRNDCSAEARDKYLELAKEGLDRIESTVSKLLWMARKSEHAPADVVIKNVVESVRSFVEYKLRKGRINFISQMPDDLHVFVDLHDFQQVLLNLFINAIQAMKDGGELTVRGYKEGQLVKVEVKDSGCGIAQENMSRIYDPFFTTKPAGEGTGLGLWLTYEIIRNYGGDIMVESEIGKGSSFTLSFPVKQAL